MTEPTDRPVHVDPDTLADHAEGLLPTAQAAEVARHLLACADCRDTRDALAEVSTLLTAYADPGPMPADVAARLDAALAAAGPVEAGQDEAADDAQPAVAAASTVVPAAEPGGRPTRIPFGSKVLQIAAVVVLIAAIGGIGLSTLLSRSSSGGSSSAAGGTAQDQRSAEGGSAGVSRSTIHAATGTAYTISNLGTVARSVATGAKTAASSPAAPSPQAPQFGASLSADQRVLVDSSAALDTCVRRLTGAVVTPVAVDLGTWEGTPATVIVLPGQDDPTMLDVFAVRASCPPGSFLGFARVHR